MKEIIFNAKDSKKIVCHLWNNVKHPKAVVQLIHGMNEHSARYDRFAKFLNKSGYIVFADDHRAHGKTATNHTFIGKTDGNKDLFLDTLNDEIEINKYLHTKYNLPVFVFAHSYGSFIAQALLEYKLDIKAICLSGTAKFSKTFLLFSKAISWLGVKLFGKDAPAYIIELASPIRGKKGGLSKLTRDIKESEKHLKDPMTIKYFSYGFYYSMFSNLLKLTGKANRKIPILIIVGSQDSVNNNAKLAKRLYKIYKRNNVKDLNIKIYQEARHELLMELNYKEVQQDILVFFNSCL